jgi:hypothetical protein
LGEAVVLSDWDCVLDDDADDDRKVLTEWWRMSALIYLNLLYE